MLVNEYRLEIQFKKVRKVLNINNIPMIGPEHWNVGLRRTYAQNRLYSAGKATALMEKWPNNRCGRR